MRILTLGTMIALLGVAGWVVAEEDLMVRVVSSCKSDITIYCRNLKPGEGHVTACLYANHDDISSPCRMALNDAGMELESIRRQISEFIDACETDRENYCPTEEWETGAVANCLYAQSYVTESVSTSCRVALRKFGFI